MQGMFEEKKDDAYDLKYVHEYLGSVWKITGGMGEAGRSIE